jgi:hypothetical protein
MRRQVPSGLAPSYQINLNSAGNNQQNREGHRKRDYAMSCDDRFIAADLNLPILPGQHELGMDESGDANNRKQQSNNGYGMKFQYDLRSLP